MIEKTFIKKNFNKMELENYLSKKLERAGFSKLEIIKTPLVTRIVLHVAKPGLAIGKSGSTIKELTETITDKFKIENPQIEIQEIKNANLNAKIIAEKMATMIERGFAWRSVSFRIIKDIMSSGAQGVELVFKGKLAGKGGRKRKQRIALGYMKKIGDQSKFVDTAKAAAYPKAGAIGIKLSIIHPDVIFPDKIDVNEVVNKIKKTKEEKKEQEEMNKESKETKEKESLTKDNKEEKTNEENTNTKETKEKVTKKEQTENKIKDEIIKEDNKTKLNDNKEKNDELVENTAKKVKKVAKEIDKSVEKAAKEIKKIKEKVEETKK